MVDRIKKLMDYKNVSATQFSDAIDIQRSSLSHVLSGRNKPSLDFMLKIKSSYPEIELDWLLLGKGNMFKTKDTVPSMVESEETEKYIKSDSDIDPDESNTVFAAVSTGLKAEKKIELSEGEASQQPIRVLLFYPDHTFETYTSRQ